MRKPAIALVDADPVRRHAVARALYETRHVEPYETPEELGRFWPDADLIFVHDNGAFPQSLFAVMQAKSRWLPVVGYAAAPELSRVVDLIHMGAADYLAWPFTSAQLSLRLATVTERAELSLNSRRRAMRSQELIKTLSPREREVLLSLAKGGTNKSIARDLRVSPRTVEIHRANMMGKLGVKHLGEAIAVALSGAISPDDAADGSTGHERGDKLC